MPDNIIHLSHITKKFGATTALEDVSISVPGASIVGFIGPDGAGKSTLMKIVLTLVKPDSGTGTVMGKSIITDKRTIRKQLGYMPETFSLYSDLSVEENLKFYFRIYKIPGRDYDKKMKALYAFNRLEDFRHTPAGSLSGGMKQKLALSCALMHDPEVLILDEPTTGVDPVSRAEFWLMLKRLKSEGKTVLVSTPYLDEAMHCDNIHLFHSGKILLQGRPADLIANFDTPFYELTTATPIQTLKKLQSSGLDARFYLIGDTIHCALPSHNGPSPEEVTKTVDKEISVSRIEPTLEDIFLDLLQRKGN